MPDLPKLLNISNHIGKKAVDRLKFFLDVVGDCSMHLANPYRVLSLCYKIGCRFWAEQDVASDLKRDCTLE